MIVILGKPGTMKYQYYTTAYVADDLSIFEFISSGKHGHIRKRILFQPTDFKGVYNLAFGDLSPGKARLYRMAVTLHFKELSEKFEIYCRVEGETEFLRFQKDLPVTGFLVKRKLAISRKMKIARKKV